MEWILNLILQLVSSADDLSLATMNEPFMVVIQEHVVCRNYFEHHEVGLQEAMRIEDPVRRMQVLGALRGQVLEKCAVRP